MDPCALCMGKKISNLTTTLSVVPDFSEDARNMVGQRTVSVVRGVFGQGSENAPLQHMSYVDQILIKGDRMYVVECT